ncbi:MAG: metal-dependent hydrolase [Candidatus Woesearchaeota archaeon]
MLAKTHVAFGILAGLITLKYTSVQNELLFIALVILGVFLPDIDHPESKVNNSLKITKVIPIIFGHRGLFHSIFAVILVFAGLWWWQGFIYGFGVSIGYLSHLVSDALTLSGVGFLNPIAHYKVRGPVQTGTLMETLLFFVVIALDVLLLVH